MLDCKRCSSDDPDFQLLVKALDADLAERDGKEHDFYAPFNVIVSIKHAVVAYENEQPVGCGAIKAFSDNAMEVKRMYVPPAQRHKGIASAVLVVLESWAAEMGFTQCVLETGMRQPEAIALYEKNGYRRIPNFGQYIGIENSVCFEKTL